MKLLYPDASGHLPPRPLGGPVEDDVVVADPARDTVEADRVVRVSTRHPAEPAHPVAT